MSERAGYVISPRLWAWCGRSRTISVLLWLIALGVGANFVWHAMVWFEDPRDAPPERRRADGNAGHAQIDFGGQWLMARMLVLGHGRELYHRQRLWQVARAGFPVENESPIAREESIVPKAARRFASGEDNLDHDANRLMNWCMGSDSPEGGMGWKKVGGGTAAPLAANVFGDPLLSIALVRVSAETVTPDVVEEVNQPAIGGALYPPVQALHSAPFGAIDEPQTAYRVVQVFGGLMVLVAGLAVKGLSRGRIPWSLATLVIFLFPGTRGGLDLGQNPTLSLAIVLWGWTLASRGYDIAGGAIWGLFAFKPVWGLAFFIVPLLTRRWRFAAGMVVTGLALVAATLPFVGIQSWFDWLHVGKEAAALYNVNNNWIHLSRDLQSIPRRMFHDFTLPQADRDTASTRAIAWALWSIVFLTTATVFLRYADWKRATGTGIAFLFFGAYLTCYRFMYYDALMIGVGCAALFAEPARFLQTRVFRVSHAPQPVPFPEERTLPAASTQRSFLGPQLLGYASSFPLTILVLLLLHENSFSGLDIRATFGIGYFAHVTTAADGATGQVTPRVEFDTGVNYPWDTAMAFTLWAWCAWRLIRGEEREGRG